jgi:hypothetical protein
MTPRRLAAAWALAAAACGARSQIGVLDEEPDASAPIADAAIAREGAAARDARVDAPVVRDAAPDVPRVNRCTSNGADFEAIAPAWSTDYGLGIDADAVYFTGPTQVLRRWSKATGAITDLSPNGGEL